MPLDPRTAFKAAFLMKCAGVGLSLEDTRKCAIALIKNADAIGAITDTARQLAGSALDLAVKSPFIAGGTVGVLGGLGLHALTTPQIDVDEAKREELIGSYRTNADRVLARMKAKQMATSAAKGLR